MIHLHAHSIYKGDGQIIYYLLYEFSFGPHSNFTCGDDIPNRHSNHTF